MWMTNKQLDEIREITRATYRTENRQLRKHIEELEAALEAALVYSDYMDLNVLAKITAALASKEQA